MRFQELRKAWLAANEPDAAIRAFDEIESILSVDANNAGESREGELRILIAPPIGVVFRARPDIGEVLIVNSWMFSGRNR